MPRIVSLSPAVMYVVLAVHTTSALADGTREKLTKKVDAIPTKRDVVTRDHRGRSSSQGGVTVLNTPIVRDHRRSTKVIDPYANKGRRRAIPSTAPPIDPGRGDGKVIVRDHRNPVVRDHRDWPNEHGGGVVKDAPVVRDHRRSGNGSSPVVRDHRDVPIVRDHRTPSKATDPYGNARRPNRIPATVRPIDPGRGDGKVVVRDHRNPVVRDHRDASSAQGDVVVKDAPVARDHRGSGRGFNGVVRRYRP